MCSVNTAIMCRDLCGDSLQRVFWWIYNRSPQEVSRGFISPKPHIDKNV